MLASYESSNHCAGVGTYLCLIAVGMDIHLGGRDFKLWWSWSWVSADHRL